MTAGALPIFVTRKLIMVSWLIGAQLALVIYKTLAVERIRQTHRIASTVK
jgi:hypothetical protein